MTVSTFDIPVEKLAWKGCKGSEDAAKILDAYNFA
jgi:hypothetical protein